MNTKPQIKDMFKISFWIVGFLSVFISGCTIYANSLLVEGLQMHPILVGLTVVISIIAAIFFAIMIVGMVYNTVIIFRWAWNHLRFISILLCLILLIVAMELGGILYTIASIKEIIRYKKQKKIYESFCGKLVKKRISVIKIVLLVILSLVSLYTLYSAIGYLVLGLKTPYLLGNTTTHFTGMFIMSGSFFLGFVATIVAIIFVIKWLKKK